jgi:hypothetical protein
VVVDLLEDDQPTRACGQLEGVRQRPPGHRSEGATMHRVPGHLFEERQVGEVDGGVGLLHDVGHRGEPLLFEQHRPHDVARVQRPTDHLVALGDEQALGRFSPGAQRHVGEAEVVTQERVVGSGDPAYDAHQQLTGPARSR